MSIIEKLASIEHEQWQAWSQTLANKEQLGEERVKRWREECWKPYAELSEEMKEHDRVWARKVAKVLAQKILEHESCQEHHEINGNRATCLDLIFNDLVEAQESKQRPVIFMPCCRECGFPVDLPRDPVFLKNDIFSLISYEENVCDTCGHQRDGSSIPVVSQRIQEILRARGGHD